MIVCRDGADLGGGEEEDVGEFVEGEDGVSGGGPFSFRGTHMQNENPFI